MKRSDIKHIASEIVRSMTSCNLTIEQQNALRYKAVIVLENKLLRYIEDIPTETRTKEEVDSEWEVQLKKKLDNYGKCN